MKLQARFLLLYLFLIAGAVVLLVAQRSLDLDRSHTVLQHALNQSKTYYQKIIDLEGLSLKNFASDYTFWDQMVEFINNPNSDFGVQNIDTALPTFGANAAWVYRLDGSLVYFKSATDDLSIKDLKLPPAFFKKLYDAKFYHFYMNNGGRLIEVRAATVHPSIDPTHTLTPPKGYWIDARFVSDDLVENLSNLTQSTLTLGPAGSSTSDQIGSDSISFAQTLPGWDQSTVSVMRSKTQVPVVNELQTLYIRQLLLLLLFATASLILIVFAIWRLVLLPIRNIANSISENKPEKLDKLSKQTTEFGSLAQTVQLSFRQQLKLEEGEFLKNKLEELNKAKSEFLAIAAHELKGPVGNVHIFSENLSDLIEQPTTSKEVLHGEVERISLQARKATVLINDIYQASKGGQALEFVKSEFDFDAFIKREVEDAQYSTQQTLVLEGSSGQKIVSDVDRLGQVITNLIRNASKYSPNDQKIYIRLNHVNNNVTVEVQDFGLGIAPEDQAKLFQRFFRSSAVAKNYPGLGLGLSVCKEIVEALGGEIWLTSELGKGSHFFFSLPVSPGSRELS